MRWKNGCHEEGSAKRLLSVKTTIKYDAKIKTMWELSHMGEPVQANPELNVYLSVFVNVNPSLRTFV